MTPLNDFDICASSRSFTALAHPQRGVDAMAGEFEGSTPLPGVTDAGVP